MPRYVFNVTDNALVKEKTVLEFPNVLAARRHAQQMASELGRKGRLRSVSGPLMVRLSEERGPEICLVLIRKPKPAPAQSADAQREAS
jgi:hypothetical protein